MQTLWPKPDMPVPNHGSDSRLKLLDSDFQVVFSHRGGRSHNKFKGWAEFLEVCYLRSRAQARCKFCRCQLPKVLRHRQFLTILTSKSLSRVGVVQILRSSTSKSAPNPRCFNDFDFQIALARRRGANFVEILGTRASAPPRFSDLPLRTFEATKLRKNTAFRAIPTRQNISAVKHRCCKSYRQLSV